MTAGPPEIPYSERYFVDREEQLYPIIDKVYSLLQGKPVRRRTTALYGPRGSGKSWLICKLCQLLADEFQNRVIVLYLVLGKQDVVLEENIDCLHVHPEDMENQPDQAVRQVLRGICERLEIGVSSDLALDTMSTHIAERYRQKNCPLVILVDGVDEVPPAFLRQFEAYLLAPLVKEPYVMVVLGGRTRDPRPRGGYTWKMPELKLYSDEYILDPFDEGWTREQLARLEDDYQVTQIAAPEAMKVGGGYPLNNAVLAWYIEGDPPMWRDKPAALRGCADILLENIDERLRDHFWALCVLRAFDEDRMSPPLAVWFDGGEAAWDYQRCRRIREDMVATRLVRWRGEQGYVMDEAVRAVLENTLWENNRERWRVLHQAACGLYAKWVECYPKAKSRWQPEVEYHEMRLQQEGDDGDS